MKGTQAKKKWKNKKSRKENILVARPSYLRADDFLEVIPAVSEKRNAAALAVQHVHGQAPRADWTVASRADTRALSANNGPTRAHYVVIAVVRRHPWVRRTHRHHRHWTREHCFATRRNKKRGSKATLCVTSYF